MARARQISKAKGYQIGLYTSFYDMEGMVNAYGIEFTLWLAGQVHRGQSKRSLARAINNWSSYVVRCHRRDFARQLDLHPDLYEPELDEHCDLSVEEVA